MMEKENSWSKLIEEQKKYSNLDDYSIDNYKIDDYSIKKKYIDEEMKNKYIDEFVKKTISDIDCHSWQKTPIETDEEKLEKMDIAVIEKFLRKKKLARLAKSEKS